MKKILRYIFILTMIMNLFSCRMGNKQFTLLSHRRTGVTFRNIIKETENFNHLNYSYLYNGAGVAIGDINNDGLPDIYFAGNLASSRLYLNKGDFKFEDISKSAGVAAKESWNNGATMADVNGDGLLDIYVCSSTDDRPFYRKNLLFINNGDMTFSEKAMEYGIEDPSYSTHSAFFDYDKDGDLDLFVLNHSVDEYAMFTKESEQLKMKKSKKYGQKFFINLGNRFVEATEESGIHSNVINFGLGVAIADFNNDQWPDIYVCNDYYEHDYLYINQKDGTFLEKTKEYFSHVSFSSMGNDAADINNDGYIDLLTLDMLPKDNYEQKIVAGPQNYEKFKLLETWGFYYQTTRNMLQLNTNGKYFTEIGQYAGIFSTNWSWSPLLCDFDNDGFKDLYISDGYGKNNTHMDVLSLLVEDMLNQRKGEKALTDMEVIEKIPATILRNYMYKNNGDLTFSNVRKEWGLDQLSLSNGAAYADLDNDGDMDLVVNNINDYAFIFRNNSERLNNNHYLKIKLIGTGMNTGGIGARVDLFCGDHQYTQEFYPSRGYMSSMDHALIFGVGSAVTVDKLRVTWPDLRVQELKNIAVDQVLTLKNQDAGMVEKKAIKEFEPMFKPLNHLKPINYRHRENDYVDFNTQPLLPWLLSTQGPYITHGDINNDGLEDVFIGGAKGYAGTLFIQAADATFEAVKMGCFERDKESEDMGVLFFDVDGDKDLDLYVVSGGNDFSLTSPELRDRLYINNGSGNFIKSKKLLPEMLSSGSCVKPVDFDQDGDIDLFIGGRLTPGLYPIAPRSYLLENNGKGHFKDVTKEKCPDLMNPGLVTDALWTDFSGDGLSDLILVGEWMPVRLFLNTGSKLDEITGQDWMNHSKGWWNSIGSGDFDQDGDIDYVFGNFGLNFQFKPTPEEPVTIYAEDFDENGSLDAIMCSYINGENYPIYSRDDLSAQIPDINKRFPSYKSYADLKIYDIYPKQKLRESLVLEVNNLSSSYLENIGNNQFRLSDLPVPAQLSPIYCIKADDFNEDGYPDLMLTGNFFGLRINYGRMDANKGVILLGDGKGNFKELTNIKSGLFIKGEVKDMAEVKLASGKIMYTFTVNNDSLRLYQKTKDLNVKMPKRNKVP